jgi:2-C-methyl-D-erythritol 4-phosphate cytidylyltransferase
LVVAAGQGRRFGGLKQFALLNGKPLIAWSLDAFERSRLTRAVVVVVNRTRIGYVRRLVGRLGFSKVSAVVAGGPTRSGSVRNGLKQMPGQGWVAVHDAARPLVTARMIDNGFAFCRRLGPATYGYPLSDTVKRVARARIISTLERKGLFAVQTPQFFPIALLKKAHEAAP